jgi:hypothetical protein
MAANYVLLEKITVGAAGASSVTFSSIPQTGYTDLVIKYSLRFTDAGFSNSALFRLNGSTTNYTRRVLEGDGAGVATSYGGASSAWSTTDLNAAGSIANTFGNCELYISNYASSNYKSALMYATMENNAATSYMTLNALLWSDTTAISSISCTGNLAQYSTFSLYGVAKLNTTPAIVPYATGGDTIMTDGTYWYHAFTSSGTFTPASGKSLSCDVIVVAGGGGGGASLGAGGGAGGLLAYSAQSVPTARTITVGAGGAGGISNPNAGAGSDGSNSSISSLTAATGGGGGGGDAARTGRNGGSGGGGAGNAGASGGTATSGQGSNGGAAASAVYALGGGGGKGSAGTAGVINQSGAGGAGVNTYSSWLSATGLGVSGFIAGGGGGGGFEALSYQPGAGGSGGGGAGASIAGSNNDTPGNPGTANTGGGGGGGLEAGNGGAGGSGLVIVRYAV